MAGRDRIEDPLGAQIAVLDPADLRVVRPRLVAERLAEAEDPPVAGQVGADEQGATTSST